MKRNNLISILLTFALLLSLTFCAGASAFAAESGIKPMQQLKLIESQIDSASRGPLDQPEGLVGQQGRYRAERVQPE